MSRREGAWTVAAAAAFLAWTAAVWGGLLDGLDHRVGGGFDAIAVPVGIHLTTVVSLAASVPAAALWAVGLVVAAVLRPACRPVVVAAILALVAADLLELLLKVWMARTPPRARTDVLPPGFSGPSSAGSYPSGHMARVAILALSTALLVPARWRARALGAAIGLALVIGWTRLYLAEHWFSDTVGGTLLGLAALVAGALAVTAGRARAARRRAST